MRRQNAPLKRMTPMPSEGRSASRGSTVLPSGKTSGRGRAAAIAAGALLVAATIAVYCNTFQVPFLFDDLPRIEKNRNIRSLWPPWATVRNTNRPVGIYTFALNYALHGYRVWGYHAVNLGIHAAAGLLLYGIVRRTLLQRRLSERYGEVATPLALLIAMLWLVHPLQTETVTYIVQRLESLAGLFYLATLYCFVRAAGSPRGRIWQGAAIACCALGMATKEVMVTAPVIVLWYDRVFVAESWQDLFARRKYLYLALAATWGVLAWAMLRSTQEYATGGLILVEGMTPWTYLLSQAGVIAHYLRLCFWPQGQCFDYSWPLAKSLSQVALPGALILGLLSLTVWATIRRPASGFLGAWFFLILAPTSSVIPIADLAFEHRMYLPLAAVATLLLIAGYEGLEWLLARLSIPPQRRRWLEVLPAAAVLVAWGTTAHWRNEVYKSELSLWYDVLDKTTGNSRAHYNLGVVLDRQGRAEEAATHWRKALELDPRSARAHNGLAILLCRQGKLDEAIVHLREAIKITPRLADAHHNLAQALFRQGKFDEGIPHYEKAVEGDSENAAIRDDLGQILQLRGRIDDAIAHYRKALQIDPALTPPRWHLGNALYSQGKHQEAVAQWREVVQRDPNHVPVTRLLAWALATCPDDSLRNGAEAVQLAGRAVQLSPSPSPALLDTLAAAHAEAGQFSKAVEVAQRALELASGQGDRPLVDALRARIKLYQAGVAFREPGSASAGLKEKHSCVDKTSHSRG